MNLLKWKHACWFLTLAIIRHHESGHCREGMALPEEAHFTLHHFTIPFATSCCYISMVWKCPVATASSNLVIPIKECQTLYSQSPVAGDHSMLNPAAVVLFAWKSSSSHCSLAFVDATPGHTTGVTSGFSRHFNTSIFNHFTFVPPRVCNLLPCQSLSLDTFAPWCRALCVWPEWRFGRISI